MIPPANLKEHLDAPNVNMVTCGGQATIPIVYAVSRVVEVPYAEIVASVSSASAGPGTRANIDEFTKTTSAGVRDIGGAARGKAIIILNPAEPPMIMRDTIFCAIPEDADREAITRSIRDVVADVQTYVPGYRLLNEPQFDEPSVVNGGNHVVTTFVEVEGAGDYLPPYAGNLDIMTAAATRWARRSPGRSSARRKHGDEPAASSEHARNERRSPRMSTDIFFNPVWDVRVTDTSLRDGSHHKRHQFTRDEVQPIVAALDTAGCPSSRSPTATASVARRSTTGSPRPRSRN